MLNATKFTLLVAIHSFLLYYNAIAGSDIYISHHGNDTNLCGNGKQPCRTIRYAISRSDPNSRLFIDSSGGPYMNESLNGYIAILHNLTISTNGTGRAVIQCSSGSSEVFNVTGGKIVTVLRLVRLQIQNCKSSMHGMVYLKNARVIVNDSIFTGNGIIFHHPQVAMNETVCDGIEVDVNNSVFNQNLVSNPFQYAFSLFGCDTVKLDIENSRMYSSPVMVKSRRSTIVSFVRVIFDGSSVHASSFYVSLSYGDNLISFNNCTVTNHKGSVTSPVTISTAFSSVGNGTAISFSNVRFIHNQNMNTMGGAMTICSQFTHRSFPNLNVHVTDCVFDGNSADDNGGAIYLTFLRSVHINRCDFRNNSATNGGAVYMEEVKNVSFANSNFALNSANNSNNLAARGGAIFASECQLQIHSAKFSDNLAQYDGSSVFAERCEEVVSIVDAVFNDSISTAHGISPRNSVVYLSTSLLMSKKATVNLANSRIMARSGDCDRSLLHIDGHVNLKNISTNCSVGHQIGCSFITPLYHSTYYQFNMLEIWCESGPPGKYLVFNNKNNECDFESAAVKLSDRTCTSCL